MTKNLTGLTEREVKESLALHGDNALTKEKRKGFFARFFENLSDPIIRILLIALGIQILFTLGNCNYVEVAGILCAILISTTVSTVSEYGSEKAFEKLQNEGLSGVASVLREGKILKLSPTDIVVGDIVYVTSGEKIHADGELLSGKISVDQSALNGESVECIKTAGKSSKFELSSATKVFRGSVVTEGSGIMRVERVGAETFYGMVAKDVQAETRVSPLKLRLGKLAKQISKIGYVMAALVGISFLFNSIVIDNGYNANKILEYLSDTKGLFSMLLHTLTLMITVVVVAAPEGLPMMITVVLSANMKRMLNDRILVKKLVGIETAGSMNILFTDKTGTLTVGKLECDSFITNDTSYKTLKAMKKSEKIYELLLMNSRYNTDVISTSGEVVGGNATDKAIYEFFSEDKCPHLEIKKKTPFSSERKYSSVTLKNGEMLIKGAAETIISACSNAVDSFGNICEFNKKRVLDEYHNATRKGLRVLGVALGKNDHSQLTFVSLIVIKDKVRSGVRESVKNVTGAGIQVVMITGDGLETAVAIAEECGIFNPNASHVAITGAELNRLSDDELKNILHKIRVVARALPQDKTRLVRVSQELNLVVGMTGDGINDAPSLKLADVGFAMGSGTDISKSAADVVILDNSFLAISKTILYGRTIFKSIRKFITFQLIMNFAACGVSLVGQFIGIETPITIIQMLWVNIIMDTLGGLAFAGEAPMEYYMREKPKRRDEPLLSKEMLNHIAFSGAYTLFMCTLFLSSPVFRNIFSFDTSPVIFYTAFYALFIFFGIFNCFSARCERLWILSNIGKNKLFVFIMLMISAIQIFMIYFGGEMFRCTPLEIKQLLSIISISFTVIPFDVIRRVVYRLK